MLVVCLMEVQEATLGRSFYAGKQVGGNCWEPGEGRKIGRLGVDNRGKKEKNCKFCCCVVAFNVLFGERMS